MDTNKIWNEALPALEKSFNRPIYEALLTSTKPLGLNQGNLEIAVPHNLLKDWLSKHCVTLLEQELKSRSPEIKSVKFIVGSKDLFTTPPLESAPEPAEKARFPMRSASGVSFLNPRYVFNTFVVGQGNRFAHAAALAVAEAPAKAYNPLFLYGGVGLGKTHLMQAIGQHVLSTKPRTKILYITTETFTNELINSIREDHTLKFKNKYRNIDLLMVDDIQFLAGKERTQEQFFHTFNALYQAGKQIVISSDRPPKEIPTLEERLRSRFEWGLTADIQAPDFETRVAILQKKAELSGLTVSNEILSYIAERIMSNIRELEGALIRVVAFASLTSAEINFDLVDHVLKDILQAKKAVSQKSLNIESIKKATAVYYNIRIDDMSAKIRTKEIALARQVAMFLARKITSSSFPKIGEEFGGRDHTTVLHAVEKIKAAQKSNKDIQEAIRKITQKVNSYTL